MSLDYTSLGLKLKLFREERGFTQEKLAEMSGLSPTHISNIETAHTKVSLPSLVTIASVLEVSMNELLEDSLPDAKTAAAKNKPEDDNRRYDDAYVIREVTKVLEKALKRKQ